MVLLDGDGVNNNLVKPYIDVGCAPIDVFEEGTDGEPSSSSMSSYEDVAETMNLGGGGSTGSETFGGLLEGSLLTLARVCTSVSDRADVGCCDAKVFLKANEDKVAGAGKGQKVKIAGDVVKNALTYLDRIYYLDRLNRRPVLWGACPRLLVWCTEEIRKASDADRHDCGGDYGKLGFLDVAYGEEHPCDARDKEAPLGEGGWVLSPQSYYCSDNSKRFVVQSANGGTMLKRINKKRKSIVPCIGGTQKRAAQE